jgi:RNase adaptor protein for sRNA GlmZ degradation
MKTPDDYYQQIHDNDLGTILSYAESLTQARRVLSRLRQQKRQLVAMRGAVSADVRQLTATHRANPLPAHGDAARQVQAERDALLHDYQRLRTYVSDLIETISAEQIRLRQWIAEEKRERTGQ